MSDYVSSSLVGSPKMSNFVNFYKVENVNVVCKRVFRVISNCTVVTI